MSGRCIALRSTNCPVKTEAKARIRFLLAVPIGEEHSFTSNAIDVWRVVSHHAAVVATAIIPADLVRLLDFRNACRKTLGR